MGGPRGEGNKNCGVGAEKKKENRLCSVEGVENEARHERSGSEAAPLGSWAAGHAQTGAWE